MNPVFKAIGALLDYPSQPLYDALPEIEELAAEAHSKTGAALHLVIAHLKGRDLMTAQEEYVELFDRTRRLSLHLHEHAYGDSRDRGMAMVNLAQLYRAHGFELDSAELPDFLPLVLEFVSVAPAEVGQRVLADATDILEALRQRLSERHSPYAALLGALVVLSGRPVKRAEVEAILSGEPEEDPDAEWEEKEITFTAGSALEGCGQPPRQSPSTPVGEGLGWGVSRR